MLILGAGYGGIFAAAYLCGGHRGADSRGGHHITIVDRRPRVQLLQQIHYIVSGQKAAGDVAVEIAELFRQQQEEKQLQFVQAEVKRIDLENSAVELSPAAAARGSSARGGEKRSTGGEKTEVVRHHYDYLVISLGAETQYFGIPGAREHAFPFRSVEDAQRIARAIGSLPRGSVVVVGGAGPSGVSLAAALSESGAAQRNGIKVKLLDSRDQLLYGWDARLSRAVAGFLKSRGVEILTGRRIVQIKPESVVTESGEEIKSGCTVWTAGVRGAAVDVTPQVARAKGDRIVVDRHCRIPGFENAYAIGDISAFDPSGRGDGAINPQLAQIAVREARFAARNIIRSERGEELGEFFTFYQRGHTIALGRKSIALLSGLVVTGDMCNYTEDTIVDNFVIEIKNRAQGLSAKAVASSSTSTGAAAAAAAGGDAGDIAAEFDFVTYATSAAFRDLVK